MCADPNNCQVMKAEHGRQIPWNLTLNREPSVTEICAKYVWWRLL